MTKFNSQFVNVTFEYVEYHTEKVCGLLATFRKIPPPPPPKKNGILNLLVTNFHKEGGAGFPIEECDRGVGHSTM